MVIYRCIRCGYNDQYKGNVLKHLNRKKICEEKISSSTKEECVEFLKSDDKDLGVNILIKEIEKLKKSMILLKSGDKCANMTGNNNTANIDNSVTINIKVNSFGETDYTVLKDKIHTCIKDGKVDEAKLIKLLHYNKKHPENHNIKITNKRENRIQLYNGENFEESNYKGKRGLWELGQDTLKNTEKNGLVDDEDLLSIEDPDTNVIPLEEKRERTNKIETVLHNGFLIN
jgi:hypothetical protein